MVVDEGLSLVGVEFNRQSTGQDSLLEAVQECGGISVGIVGGVCDEPTMVVDNDAQLGGKRFAVRATQGWSVSKIHHPEVVGPGSFKGFGRAICQASGFQAARVVVFVFEEPAHGAFRG